MATIGTLAVNIVANTRGLTAGLGKARKEVKGFGGGLAGLAAKAKSLITPFVGITAATVAATVAFRTFLRTLAEIDRIAKVSTKLGLAVEALQSLQFAAELTGAKTQTLNMALQRMTRRISEAAMGTGEAVAAIRELGLDAKKLQQAGPAAAFSAIADAMTKVQNEGDKVRLSFKLFDSEGVDLKNTLAGGSAGLAEMRKELFELGGTMSKNATVSAEMLSDAIKKLKVPFIGIGRAIVTTLAPAITFLIDRFLDVVRAFNKTKNALFGIEQPIVKVTNAFLDMTKAVKKTKEQLAFANKLFDAGQSAIEQHLTPLEKYQGQIGDLRRLLAAAAIDQNTFNRAVAKSAKDFKDATRAKRSFDSALRGGVSAAVRGTVGGFSAEASSRSANVQLANIGRQQLREQERTNAFLARIERKPTIEVNEVRM